MGFSTGSVMAWVVKQPLCRPDVYCAVFILVVSMIGFAVAVVGIDVIPKCRYGESACYFTVKLCPFNAVRDRISAVHESIASGPSCVSILKTRAVEGSSTVSGEQFALPIFALLISLVPCVLTLVSVIFNKALAMLEIGKVFVAINISVLLMTIRIVDNVTFDCRWWADRHHGNADECHTGLALYVVGSVLLIASQISLLTLAVIFVEHERKALYGTKEESVPLTRLSDGDARDDF